MNTSTQRHRAAVALNELTLPPQNLQAERYVLGGEMLDAGQIDAVRAVLKPEDFYSDIYAKVQQAL